MSDAKGLPEWAANYFKHDLPDALLDEPDPVFEDYSLTDDPAIAAIFQIAAGIEAGETHPTDAEELRLIAKHFQRMARSYDELVDDAMKDAPAPVYVDPPRPRLTLIEGASYE